ncbi:hypothetical protein [Candidatus Phycosocius spiralis]|uniref:Uncharacterized protein n=1 Tax=Candidatus Phycosocius spiralis TaxID=2815099 RepID=A0ABQ4PVF1_9PROT|nr:hypothetical protein [Candidatus Phycosocius spiralis]GIU66864.1 hypothetical protein PsB1_1018 [Candidatus Phycosocius spiralis]
MTDLKGSQLERFSKVAEVTIAFWVMKIAATTSGETGLDLISMTLHVAMLAVA